MGQQFLDALVGAGADRPVSGQQPGVGQRQRAGQRAEVVTQGHPVAGCSNPIEGVISGSTWSPANMSRAAASWYTRWPRVWPGVCTARRTRVRRSRSVPSASQRSGSSQSTGGRLAVLRGQLAEQLQRTQPAQAVDAEEPVPVAVDHLPGRDQVGAFLLAQADHAVERLAQLDRQGVVVDVDVGDEEVADVASS